MINGMHGGNDLCLDIKLDLSANLNPLGMPESVRNAVAASAAEWERYPDPMCRRLRRKLSERLHIASEKIVCGNGADDLIYRTVSALRPRRALICAPAFVEYRRALEEYGCGISEHMLSEKDSFALTERIIPEIAGNDMLIICSPHNPAGTVIEAALLGEIAAECEKQGTYLFCDESFIDFTERAAELTALNFINDRLIVLRSFTKIYAMAGLRLGYVVCGSMNTAGRIGGAGQYWSVSAPAMAAGMAALDEEDYVKRTVQFINREREYLSAELDAIGFRVYPSQADYILFRAFPQLGELLLRQGILIRYCGDYSGLDSSFFRTAVGTHSENMTLISALRRIVNG